MNDEVALLGAVAIRDEVVKRVRQGDHRLALTGRRAVGKSTIMAAAAAELGRSGCRIVRTAMPAGDDAGPVAMALVAEQLGGACREVVHDVHASWRTKLEALVAELRTAGPRVAGPRSRPARAVAAPGVVVTIDDPRFGRNDQATTVFDERAVELVGRLASLENVAVIAAASWPVPLDWGPSLTVPASADIARVLADPAIASLAGAAAVRELAAAPVHRSPLELRVLVAIETRRRHAAVDALAARLPLDALIDQLLDSLGPAAQQGCLRASVMRTAFDDQALASFWRGAADADLPLVRGALLVRSAGGWVLPDAIATRVRAREVEQTDLDRAHRIAAEFHARAFTATSKRPPQDLLQSATRHELEQLHHLVAVGDLKALEARRPFFVDYFDAIGRQLGQRGVRRYGSRDGAASLRLAAEAYKRALAIDDNDAYAHHYLAYNLDLLARTPDLVETHYRRAIALDPGHVWHHGRLITFLVTDGRVLDAAAAWEDVTARFPQPQPAWLYEELHRPVARLLLDRGELDFAERVLGALPAVADASPWARSERRLLRRLRDAADDRLVFPASIEPTRRWTGPHLVDAALRSKVKAWWAGRIEAWDEERCVIRIASDAATFGRRWFTEAELTATLGTPRVRVGVGRFLEIVQWKGGDEAIYLHPDEVDDPDLPAVFPPANRYLTRGERATRARA